MKLNRKGFTLVELLVTIAIIALVLGFSIFGIISLINNSNEKVTVINEKSIKEAANIYSSEADNSSWKKNNNYDAFCVTVGELMNKGFLEKNSILENKDIKKDTYVIVKRNNVTFSIISEEIVPEIIGDEYNKICTGQSSSGEKYNAPIISTSTNYTDMLKIPFSYGSADSGIKNYKCLYGESSSNVNKEGNIENNTCIINDLKNNSDYYVLVYMNTNGGSTILAEGDRNYTTSDFNETTLSQNKNEITINYNNKDTSGNNINTPSYYFKSNVEGNTDIDLEICVLENDRFTCSEKTKEVRKDMWYKTSNISTKITYPEENSEIVIDTRIYDGSNNYRRDNKKITIKKYIVKFYRNDASSIDGTTTDYVEKYCITNGNNKCSITSPSIESKTGYSVVGWNTSASATTSGWNVNTQKEINSNANYYAISKINTYSITYNLNGGSVTGNPNSYTIETSTITLKNPEKTGYTFTGWTGSNGNTQNTTVTIPKGSTGNKSYTANWKANSYTYNIVYKSNSGTQLGTGTIAYDYGTTNTISPKSFTGYTSPSSQSIKWDSTSAKTITFTYTPTSYTITYNLNGGSVTGNPTSYTIETSTITLKNPSKTGYTFTGWTESNGNTQNTTITIPKGSTGNKSYTANWEANKYTIAYELNGGTAGSKAPTSGTYNSDIQISNPTRTGYTFAGWTTSTSSGLENNAKTGTSASPSTAWSGSATKNTYFKNLRNTSGTVTLTATWTANTNTAYKVQHWQQNIDADDTQNSTNYTLKDTDSLTGTTGASITPTVKTYTGFTSPSTQTVTIAANGSTVVNYYYTRNSYTVTLTKGTGISSVSGGGTYDYGKSVTIDATVSTGYTWSKWTGTHSTTTKKYTFTIPASNVSDTANATANTYTIAYELNGGTAGSKAPTSGTYNSDVQISNPTRTGYTFAGWTTSTSAGLENNAKTGTSASPSTTWSGSATKNTYFKNLRNTSGTVTLTATWTASTYTITYSANGGSGAPSSQTATIGTATTLSSSVPTYKSGSTHLEFVGWNTKSDGTGTTYSSGASYNGSSDVTLYAVWHEHTWNAIGNNFFGTGGLFTCGYIHTKAYTFYCGECGMSARYYNSKYGFSSGQSGYVATMACPAYITLKIFFDDSSLFNSSNHYDISKVEAWGGIYNGGSKLPSASKPAANSSEHKPNISISSNRVGSKTGSTYNGSWTNKNIYTTISYSGNGTAIDLTTLQYGYNYGSWTNLSTSGCTATECYDEWTAALDRHIDASYKICDVKGNCATTSFELKQDVNGPSCEITVATKKTSAVLTVNGSDEYSGLGAYPYSWTSSSSGFGVTKTKTVSKSGTYYAYVRDVVGNVTSCSKYVHVGANQEIAPY